MVRVSISTCNCFLNQQIQNGVKLFASVQGRKRHEAEKTLNTVILLVNNVSHVAVLTGNMGKMHSLGNSPIPFSSFSNSSPFVLFFLFIGQRYVVVFFRKSHI